MKRVLVIGGGPAGMMAAYSAASQGAQVNIIDRNEEFGRKLLLTGNGKCNYSNDELRTNNYNFDNDHPFASIIEEYDSFWLEKFFKDNGLFTYRKDTLLYPKSEKAVSVRDILVSLLQKEGVKILTGKYAKTVSFDNEYKVSFEDGSEISADKLIIATGGKAYPSTGSDGGGYKIARSLGHKVEFTYPVLTRLLSNDKFIENMAGVRNKGKVYAIIDGIEVATEEGEIQFTKEGLSGICIFNLSRFLSKPLEEGRNCQIAIDFMPETSIDELRELLSKRENIEEFLTFNFGEKTARFIDSKCTDKDYAKTIKRLIIDIENHDSFANAQVTKGGVNINEIHNTLESKITKGLYFAGEVVDVDGKCGGYNLHWAFASGYVAGLNAGRKE